MRRSIAFVLAMLPLAAACTTTESEVLTVYSGREQELVEPLFDAFTQATGIEVDVRYGDSAALAAQILEEGEDTPADLFFAQDGGALGAVAAADLFQTLPDETLEQVDGRFRSDDGTWVGVSGRARTIVYNTDLVEDPELMPDTIFGFTDPAWKGTVGWAPTNGSFQAFVTAMRLQRGDAKTREWLEGMVANDVVEYPKNTPIVQAVIDGEITAGFVNHYYLLTMLEDHPDAPAANLFLPEDVGGLVNVAGVGILASTHRQADAQAFVDHLLGTDAQSYFATETFEYPLVAGVEADPRLPPLEDLEPPDLDLSDLSDLAGTLDMLADEGIL